MFIVDAFLGNFDRHNGNWGFLINRQTNKCEIAPIFDCGSCLLPQADKMVMETVLSNEFEMDARIYRFPTSAIQQNGVKINYFDFLNNNPPIECKKALKRIYERINLSKINEFIDGLEIDCLQKKFYKVYLENRYKKLLTKAYQNV